ncbi:glycoside hydrolase family 13 protein [Agrococcus casei]|uniref:glycoside hydrolase family 13 protein n=2 Tax=Agrococcus casei TaxID=343512 RepID=UPI003F9296B1
MTNTIAVESGQQPWWRDAVIYQIYPRSFADSTGSGVGDLRGITDRLDHIAALGVDAVWLSPFYKSPQNDAGYDVSDYTDVDPLFGTLADFDAMLEKAHALGLRVIIDTVPNHSSDQHEWFQAALAAAPGSPERDRYMFRDGKGADGSEPPNNWPSIFGGPAWTRVDDGQWYLHIFDTSQPDFNWRNPAVGDMFEDVLRFWLDRGVDGFRVDVAHGCIKPEGLPDMETHDLHVGEMDPPYFGHDETHEIYRRWRRIFDSYEGDRVLCAEAWVHPIENIAKYVRPDEMHQAFNFGYLEQEWDAQGLRAAIEESLQAFGDVGAPATWVLSNHDTIRHRTRLSLEPKPPHGRGLGPDSPEHADPKRSRIRARAATMLMLALPGGAYIYQGEELGLTEVRDIPDDAREDPTFARTQGEQYGRDGCRVPIPWEADAPAYGFNNSGRSWLPQPAEWAEFARDRQIGDDGSMLELYREAIRLRSVLGLGSGAIEWVDFGPSAVAFRNGQTTVITNFGAEPIEVPAGLTIQLASGHVESTITADQTVWLTATE